MAGPFKVRLDDGMEVGPLDGEMLRSWYQQGLINRETKVRAKGSKQWVRLRDTYDISDWGASGSSAVAATRGASARDGVGPGLEDAEGEELGDVSRQTWRTYVTSALFFLLAAGSGYFFLFPNVWRTPPGPPWRDIALGFLVVGLMLVRGWEPMRKAVRVLILILTLALFPLAEVLIFRGVPWRSLVVLLPAVAMGFGLFFFVSGRRLHWTRVALSLFWVVVGAAGVVFLGAFPTPGIAAWMAAPSPLPAALRPAMLPGSTLAAGPGVTSPAAAPVAAPAAPPAATTGPVRTPPPTIAPDAAIGAPSAASIIQEVPLLSPAAAEIVRTRAVYAPEDAFRRSYELAGSGVAALSAPERRDLGELMAVAYANIPAADRRRLETYMAGIRGGQISTTELNREMSALMRGAVLQLAEPQRSRLQALYEKAILSAR